MARAHRTRSVAWSASDIPFTPLYRIAGYNMLHFTPVEQLGEGGSAYCIYDQLMLDSKMFKGDSTLSEAQREAALIKVLEDAARNGVLGLGDMVLNHTAANSPWLCD